MNFEVASKNKFKTAILVILIFLIIVNLYHYWKIYDIDDSNYIIQENYSNESNNDEGEDNKFKFIVYHWKDCGHCLELMETKQSNGLTKYEELNNLINNNDKLKNKVVLLEFELTNNQNLMKKRNINSYPTIYSVTKNNRIEYKGNRSIQDMFKFIMTNYGTGVLSKNINTINNKSEEKLSNSSENENNKISDIGEKNKFKFIVYHWKDCGHCLELMETKQSNGLTKYEELNNLIKNDPILKNKVVLLEFELTNNQDLMEKRNINSYPTIYAVTQNNRIKYNGDRNVPNMFKFIQTNSKNI